MYTIATLDDLRRHLNLSATDTDSDQDLLHSLQEASQLIESLTQRRYCPLLQTRTVALNPADPRELILPDDLLELRSISAGARSLDLADIRRLPRDRDAPTSVLQLVKGASFAVAEGDVNEVSIEGTWGWHDRWTQAWRASGDAVRDNMLDEAATVINVNDTAASDLDGFSPRFQVGRLLRIDAEYMRLTAVDGAQHRLTVLRGVQGTAATSHRLGAKIDSYAPALAIRDLTLRYAELMIKSHGFLERETTPLLERMRRLTA